MSFEADLQSLLLASPAVTALVGNRIAADRIEQTSARPFVVYTRSDTERTTTLDGTLIDVRATFGVQCWADTRLAAQAVADAVTAAIEAAQQATPSQVSAYDGDLDLEAAILSVDWWP